MRKQMRSQFVTIVAVFLAISMTFPVNVFAAMPDTVEPLESAYLVSYTAYVGPVGNGKVQLWFRVTGTDYMADIGALTIVLYESTDNETWTWVETFRHTEYENMLSHDDSHHMSYVEYQGVAGRYYKAYVCIWSGDGTDGDSRYFWTSVKQAT